MNKSDLEEIFGMHCRAYGLEPIREYKFHPVRRWKFDFCWPARMIAVEIEGGIWTNGRHSRGVGAIKDMEKYNTAASLGWFVFRFDGGAVKRGEAIKFMLAVLGQAAQAREGC